MTFGLLNFGLERLDFEIFLHSNKETNNNRKICDDKVMIFDENNNMDKKNENVMKNMVIQQ